MVLPSTMGRISRCTPSRETSGPLLLPFPIILSISSMKIIPFCSASRRPISLTSSMSINFCASWFVKILRASLTLTWRFFFLDGRKSPRISLMLMLISSFIPAMTPMVLEPSSSTSISITSSSILPSARSCAMASRLIWRFFSFSAFSASLAGSGASGWAGCLLLFIKISKGVLMVSFFFFMGTRISRISLFARSSACS